ncbi:MAG: hypothetical protein DRJ30_07480 [Candidatus Methanomethylicota archaeon]|nr:MAG: hypothetical protein DRJ30_07480 [Candidatus Verstraetearchaeota archaeon]
MELTVSRIIWLVLALSLIIGVGMTIYSWGFKAAVKADFMQTIIAYDDGRVEITLKNVGTVDITDLTVKITAADGSKLSSPVELDVKLADYSSFIKLSAGGEVQLICEDWTVNGSILAENTLTFEIICSFANGEKISHALTVPIQSI